MKILLAPSKTKSLKGEGINSSFKPEMSKLLLETLQNLSVEDLSKGLKLDEEKAEYWHEFYRDFSKQEVGKAIESYNGLVFKRLAYENLSLAGQKYCQEHVIILSGFYGLVQPNWEIKDYRLDLVDKIFQGRGENLTKFWQPVVSEYFKDEDWLLNLSSKEYSKLVEHPRVVNVEFLQLVKGKWRQGSTSSKEMRGLLAGYCCEHEVTTISELPKNIGGYTLVDTLPATLEENIVIKYCQDN